jgi:hypothetical protein
VQAEEVAQLGTYQFPPLKADLSTPAKQEFRSHGVQDRTIAKSLPIHAIRAIEHDFVRMRLSRLALTGAKEHVHHGGSSATVRMRDQDNGMLPFVGKNETPYLELILQGDSNVQPFSKLNSSLSFWRVKYLFRLPLGKVSFFPAFTTVSVKLPLPRFS